MDATFADPESAARDYANTLDLGDASGKVFLTKPRGQQLPRNYVTVTLVGGESDSHGLMTLPDIQFDVYSKQGKGTAAAIANALAGGIQGLVNGTSLNERVRVSGADITSLPSSRPTAQSEHARYLLTARFRLWPYAAVA